MPSAAGLPKDPLPPGGCRAGAKWLFPSRLPTAAEPRSTDSPWGVGMMAELMVPPATLPVLRSGARNTKHPLLALQPLLQSWSCTRQVLGERPRALPAPRDPYRAAAPQDGPTSPGKREGLPRARLCQRRQLLMSCLAALNHSRHAIWGARGSVMGGLGRVMGPGPAGSRAARAPRRCFIAFDAPNALRKASPGSPEEEGLLPSAASLLLCS